MAFLLFYELQAHRCGYLQFGNSFWSDDACRFRAAVHFDSVVVATCHEDVIAVGRQCEISRMAPRKHVLQICQVAVFFDGEHADAIVFKAVGCIQEFAVGADVNVCRAVCADCVANGTPDFLDVFAVETKCLNESA